MRLLLMADGRSPITRNWLRMLSGLDWDIRLVSTFPCNPPAHGRLASVLPVGFASLAGGQVGHPAHPSQRADPANRRQWGQILLRHARPLLRALRAQLGPLTLGAYQRRLMEIAGEEHPDLAHSLRIPYEGMLAAALPASIPLIVSIWGNDLTLHARSSACMGAYTRRCLQRTDGLLADAARDLRLADNWGLPGSAPRLVLPGNGGLDFGEISAALHSSQISESFQFPKGRPVVVNPRGFRPGSVHQDTFFRSLPRVLKYVPEALVVCTAMQDQPQAQFWVRKLKLQQHVQLLPYLPQEELWRLFSKSDVYVSLSSHDGTPNTFLEALACGCFPVTGDIESLREWISDGHNGFLLDPHDAQAAADAMVQAIKDIRLREQARLYNQTLLREHAHMPAVRKQFSSFVDEVLKTKRSAGGH